MGWPIQTIAMLITVGCAVTGCADADSDRDDDDEDRPLLDTSPEDGDDTAVGGDDTSGGGGDDTGETSTDDSIEAFCGRFNEGIAAQAEGSWNGDISSCDAGDMPETGLANTLAILNTYRWLAGLPAVTSDATKNAAAQECALMMHAAGALSHSPGPSWPCYTATGAGAAGTSNIASAPAVSAMDLYFVDPGNATTLGHRRWFLSNSLGPIGIGTTSGYSCATVLYGSGSATKAFTAWPPRGRVPYRAISTPHGSMDTTGWSVQSDSIRLTGAEVSVTSDGVDMPVRVTELLANYGSTYAISVQPNGWTTAKGATYEVEVRGTSETIEYEVEVIDCDAYR